MRGSMASVVGNCSRIRAASVYVVENVAVACATLRRERFSWYERDAIQTGIDVTEQELQVELECARPSRVASACARCCAVLQCLIDLQRIDWTLRCLDAPGCAEASGFGPFIWPV